MSINWTCKSILLYSNPAKTFGNTKLDVRTIVCEVLFFNLIILIDTNEFLLLLIQPLLYRYSLKKSLNAGIPLEKHKMSNGLVLKAIQLPYRLQFMSKCTSFCNINKSIYFNTPITHA